MAFLQAQPGFIRVSNGQFLLQGKPYYYVGANYWYGGLLSLNGNTARGRGRLVKELDFLQRQGIRNIRVLAGAEGAGPINGVPRVQPALQTAAGQFDTSVLAGLDYLLYQLGKRKMTAVVFLSNNWEWSGGFLQHLNWQGLLPDSVMRRKMNWEENRDYVSRFYTCDACKQAYASQVKLVVQRINRWTGKKYTEDPAIMAWELANEPRPMRPTAIPAYKSWLKEMAALVKSLDPVHLVTIGAEGAQGTENLQVFEETHADRNIDYLTIHIWPKNWGWFSDTSIAQSMDQVLRNTHAYVAQHVAVAERLKKPLVIEEFGLPRNQVAFDPASPTSLRDTYYRSLFGWWKPGSVIAGYNFWAYSGSGRPLKGQVYWKAGDDYLGDPPAEEQGLNSVFDTDASTWQLIRSFIRQNHF